MLIVIAIEVRRKEKNWAAADDYFFPVFINCAVYDATILKHDLKISMLIIRQQ